MFFVGADGCRAGWFAIKVTEDNYWETAVFQDVSSLWDKYSNASIILLDIPIGLREKCSLERTCDIEARRLLGFPRRTSVFPVPCRPAILAKTYEKARDINEQTTGRGLSLQTWYIIPKIREVDILLTKNESTRTCIREIHPEICFWALAGRQPMQYSKRSEEGILERKKVLQSVYPYTNDIIDHALDSYRRNEVAKDDILDALSAVITAITGIESLISIPEIPEHDPKGLHMEMVYRNLPHS
jgi:predicted RNase H-like nuclease